MGASDLDEVIDGLGFGKFQFICIALLGGIMMVDGMQMILASALVGSVASEFDASPAEKGMLTSVVFFGLLFGSVLSGPIGDQYGRRRACIVAYSFIVVFGLLVNLGVSLYFQYVTRFFVGLGAGCGVPAVVTLMVESTPTQIRSHVVNGSQFFFPIGEAWAAIGLIIWMPDLVGNNWRTVSVFGIGPALLMFPFVILVLKESPHWLYMTGRKQELQDLLSIAAEQNDKRDLDLSINDDVEVATSSSHEQESTELTVAQRFQMLFNEELLVTTVICCFLTFMCNFTFYGQSYALAQQFEKADDDFASPAVQMLIASLFEVPGFLLALMFIQAEWIGHRDTISVCSILSGILICALISMDYGIMWVADPAAYLIKLITAANFNIVYVYIPEAYPSLIRQTAVGFCICVGRLGSVMAPLIYEYLYSTTGASAAFLLVSMVMCVCGAWVAQDLPVETKGMHLAQKVQEEIVVEMSETGSRWSKARSWRSQVLDGLGAQSWTAGGRAASEASPLVQRKK